MNSVKMASLINTMTKKNDTGAEPPLVAGAQARNISRSETKSRQSSAKASQLKMLFHTKFILAQSLQKKSDNKIRVGRESSDDQFSTEEDDDDEEADDGYADEDSSDSNPDRAKDHSLMNSSVFNRNNKAMMASDGLPRCRHHPRASPGRPVKSLRKPLYSPRQAIPSTYSSLVSQATANFRPLFLPNPRLTYSMERSATAPVFMGGSKKRPLSIASKQWLACKDQVNSELRVFPYWGELKRTTSAGTSFLPSLAVIQKENFVIDFEEQRKRNPVTLPYKEFYKELRQHFKEIHL